MYRSLHCGLWKACILAVLLWTATGCQSDFSGTDYRALQAGFQDIPDSVKLSIYWYWINGNVSEQGVAKDLRAMAANGIGRAYIGNIGLDSRHGDSSQAVRLFSDQWWRILAQAFKTADSLGMEIGLFNSPGWSQSGGPWVQPKAAMRYLATEGFSVRGPVGLKKQLTVPDSAFQPVAVLAFPLSGPQAEPPLSWRAVSLPQGAAVPALTDGDTASVYLFRPLAAGDTAWVLQMESDTAVEVQSLLLYPADKPFRSRVQLQVSDGDGFRTIKTFWFDRSNMNKNVGFMPRGPVAVTFSPVKARRFRLLFSSFSKGGGLADINLTGRPYVAHYVEKQLGKMFQAPQPDWASYKWGPSGDSGRLTGIPPKAVLDISDHVAANGVLNWQVPEGQWRILQIGMRPTGVTNAPATPEATGLEVDKMNQADLKEHFDAFIGKVLQRIPAAKRKAFKYVVADSYETGSENWTDSLAKAFKATYGYDPIPWLPVITGRIVGNAAQSDRFLWDLRRLVADRVAYQYVGGLRALSHANGLKVWLENYGHWGFPGEFLQYGGQSDELGGEFWAEGDLGRIELKDASSAAHIYGKNKVYAESFTAAGKPFQRYPAVLKKKGDWSFTEGVNSTLLHVYIAQPHDHPQPGINAWFGTEFNRKNTWFQEAGSYFDYLRRCNFMLQQGQPVKDVAYYIGESTPVMTGIQSPPLPAGYAFDYINAEVIENRLQVKDGDLILPDGIRYRMLVLPPEETMRPEVLQKLEQLVAAGATILGPRPLRSPSLEGYPEVDRQVRTLADKIWQQCDGKKVKMVHYGKGLVLDGLTMKAAFEQLKTGPDFSVEEKGSILYTHRRLGQTDIYFISNQSDSTIRTSAYFRVAGKQPEWWDPVQGTSRPLPVFTQEDQGTRVPLELEPAQSGFVVFAHPAQSSSGAGENFPEPVSLQELGGPWSVQFDTAMGGPGQKVEFPKLADWRTNPDSRIKYYSGSAVYTTTFQLNALPADSTFDLDLGKVAVLATVTLNGHKIGGVWTTPYRLGVTGLLKQGANRLEIRVVNTWVNRLIGDSRLPSGERKTRADVNPYQPDSPLMPSGLLGPVRILASPAE